MKSNAQWIKYRKRRNLFWLIFATYMPGVFIFGIILGDIVKFEYLTPVVALLWMAAWILRDC
jgi:hypothetical protein